MDDAGHAMTEPLIVPKLRAPGKIIDTVLPSTCLEWALQHCERRLHLRDNEDIDWPDPNVRLALAARLSSSSPPVLLLRTRFYSALQANALSELQWKQLFDWHKIITQYVVLFT